MLKLETHSGFHELFWFWYVYEYKYGSILWLENGHLYLHLWTMSHTINKWAIYRLGIISLAHAAVHVTDFPVVNVHVDELSSARIWLHKLCATLSTNVNINDHLLLNSNKVMTHLLWSSMKTIHFFGFSRLFKK
jgi:hypothetical protein